jgi:protein SCO1/2
MNALFFKMVFLLTPLFAHEAHHHEAMKASAPLSGSSVYHLMDSWSDQNGNSWKLKDFSDKKIVITMLYLTCKSACPVLTADVKRIASRVPQAKDKTHFLLVSIDPKRDSVAELKKFADRYKLGEEFSVLTGKPEGVRQLAAALGVQYKQEKNGEFQHSNLITLLNEKGEIIQQVQGLGADASQLVEKLR